MKNISKHSNLIIKIKKFNKNKKVEFYSETNN